ncbi:hypothetical protein HUJ05_000780 [Dendroctonus ponderosae]|nr:hypothetical protein HUJ05_000780 [Dendroctonus ponderosae]
MPVAIEAKSKRKGDTSSCCCFPKLKKCEKGLSREDNMEQKSYVNEFMLVFCYYQGIIRVPKVVNFSAVNSNDTIPLFKNLPNGFDYFIS